MRRVLVVVGTRPEAIKMAPVIHRLRRFPRQLRVELCVTAQHREMLDQVLELFGLTPEYDLDLMKAGQNLFDLTAGVISELRTVLEVSQPDWVLVHGDTTTSFAASLAAYYHGARVGHVEAGLRTHQKRSPFPEEINRQLTGRIADLHFAPTDLARENLISEGVPHDSIFVTGNTVVDALLHTVRRLETERHSEAAAMDRLIDPNRSLILVTAHRRENFGAPFVEICTAIRRIAERPDVQIVFPVHPNPNVQEPVVRLLSGVRNVTLIDPVSYMPFVRLLDRSRIILTDSGGVQEEAPSLGKPVLVMRDATERPEAVAAGTATLVGTSASRISAEVHQLLEDADMYRMISAIPNPYGDGHAAERIAEVLLGDQGIELATEEVAA